LSKPPVYLMDVNPVLARLDEAHEHHSMAKEWFAMPGLRWALCPFTEAGVLRYFTRPKTGGISMGEATAMLERLKQGLPGYRYQPVAADWQTLTKPFFKRLQGHNQVTDAYLLGLALSEGLILATFDKAILHLAGEHSQHVHVLEAK
jgi:predicted nucleic acid-binding protein